VFSRRHFVTVEGFSAEAVEALEAYDWPGNVRELKNLVEALFVQPPDGRVVMEDLPEDFRRRLNRVAALPGVERRRLIEALTAAKWNKSRAAEMLQWSRMTLYRKMTKHALVRSDECHAVSQPDVTSVKRKSQA
jgi:transcriptional regulator of acetoin/glycerol metabolism